MLLYTTGTINQPDAGSVGLSMAEKIRDDLILNAAWSLVEEFTPASGAIRWYVFKCAAAASGLSADFYVVMGRTLATGELRFAICETYDSTTHTMRYPAINGNSSSIAYDASGRRDTTFVLGTTAFTTSSGQPHYFGWTPGSTSTKWWLVAAEDGFTVAFNGAANAFVHVGAYAPLSSLTNNLPIQITGSSDGNGSITRNPAVASQNTYDWALTFTGGGGTFVPNGPILGFQGDLRNNDKLQGNERPVAEQGMSVYQGVTATTQTPLTGWALGKQKRMRVGIQSPAGVAFGDAYALGGSLWVPYLPTDPRIWDTGVAA